MWPWNYKREIARLRSAVQKAEKERDIAVGERNDVLSIKRKAREDLRAMKKDRNEWRDSAMALKEEFGEKKDEIARLQTAEATRPVLAVTVYESKQGRKKAPCLRFVARDGKEVVAVSPPQGTPDMAQCRRRIALLSSARWDVVDG